MSGPDVRLLVFGAGGQLGRELDVVTSDRSVAATLLPRQHADICDRHAVVSAVQRVGPTVIVNAAAYTKVDQAEVEPEHAFSSNCKGPALLADVCAERGLPLVHVSTDYVFDGTKPTPYMETDPVAPMGAYGRSKEAGEQAVRTRLERHVILRTAWVYGVHGSNFLKTMLRLACQKESWGVVADQCGNPTATVDLAEAILAIATRATEGVAPWGTYHFAGSGDATWYGFACEIIAAQALFTNRRPTVAPISTADYPTRARRPANSRLDSTRFAAAFGVTSRPWQQRTREVVAALMSTSARGG
jgi:dTDP-4-dehydrorhamnose reductase